VSRVLKRFPCRLLERPQLQHDMSLSHDLETDELSSGCALLYGQYKIERHLIDGGFGMTYLARDSLDRMVVIKECFPSTICRRVDGEVRPRKLAYQEQYQSVIRNFLREALRLARFEHANIVKVHQVFQENNTAYIAMDYVDGMDLLSMLDLDPGRLADTLVHKLLSDTLNALGYVHEFGMLHRDISPDNLLLDKDDNLTLIDFGAAREDARRQTRALSSVLSVKDGYSPHEFYYTDGSQDPSSDIYSVGATFYHLITGKAPPDCQKRLAAISSGQPDPCKLLVKGAWSFDRVFLAAIDKALSVSQKERFQCVDHWLDLLTSCKVEVTQDPVASALVIDRDHVTEAQAVATVELEPNLAQVISSLVQDTNNNLEQGQPATTRPLTEKVEDTSGDAPLVDMFGSPIKDLQAWQREQDKAIKRSCAKEGAAKEGTDSEHDAEESGFGLSRVFRSLSKLRRRAPSMAET